MAEMDPDKTDERLPLPGRSATTTAKSVELSTLKKVESSPSSLSESVNSNEDNSQTGSIVGQVLKKSPKDYIFGKNIGEGSFSSVFLAKDVNSQKEYAIKVCDKAHIIRERKTEQIKREKEVMAILSSNSDPKAPFFVHLFATFQDKERLYFVMTFGAGGELLKYLSKVGSFDIECSRFYTGEIIQALRHLHKLGIVHRDLKPENILLDENRHILITDFGSSKVLKSKSMEDAGPSPDEATSSRTRRNSFVGTAQYVSPEVLQGKYSSVGSPADLWAVGCILYQFISGLPPFHGPTEYLIFQKIMKLEYEIPQGFDPKAKDLVEKLLKIEPSERLGSLDMILYTSIQSHPFFDNINFDTLYETPPPQIMPYLPSSDVNEPPLRSATYIPDYEEPGFNPRVIAERVLREDLWSEPSSSSPTENTAQESPKSNKADENDGDLSRALGSIQITSNGDGGGVPKSISKPPRGKNKDSPLKGQIERSLTRSYLPNNEEERETRLREQGSNNNWHGLVKGNLILKQGLVNKRKGLFSRKRMLLLTEGPHLYYAEPGSMNLKGEIPWSAHLKPEPKDFKIFFVHTPSRTYYLEDPEGYALEWCKAINEVKSLYFDGQG